MKVQLQDIQTTVILIQIVQFLDSQLYESHVSQVYLKSTRRLMRDVYLIPTEVMELRRNVLTEPFEQLYTRSESGEYRARMPGRHLEKLLGKTCCTVCTVLHFCSFSEYLFDFFATYVRFTVHVGSPANFQTSELTLQKF